MFHAAVVGLKPLPLRALEQGAGAADALYPTSAFEAAWRVVL